MLRGGNDTTLVSNDEGSGGVSAVMFSVDVGSLAAFNTKGNPSGISQRWKKWRRSLFVFDRKRGDGK